MSLPGPEPILLSSTIRYPPRLPTANPNPHASSKTAWHLHLDACWFPATSAIAKFLTVDYSTQTNRHGNSFVLLSWDLTSLNARVMLVRNSIADHVRHG